MRRFSPAVGRSERHFCRQRPGPTHGWGAAFFAVLGFWLGVTALAADQSRNVYFKRLSLEQGLPAANVHQMIQDRDGFLWLATQDGLSRFDGYEFTVHRHRPSEALSIPNSDVRAVLETADGSLLVGTDGGGASRLDQATGSFIQLGLADPGSGNQGPRRVRSMLEDSNGTLWVGTEESGLWRLSQDSRVFTAVPLDQVVEDAPESIRDVYQDRDGVLWVLTADRGLRSLDPVSGEVTSYRHRASDALSLSSDRLLAVAEDRDGGIWIGTENAGLNRLDRQTGDFERFAPSEDDNRTLSDRRVRTLLVDESGTLWIGTFGGLNEWRPGTGDFVRHQHSPSDPLSLSHNVVTSLFQDRGGVLWVGTYNGLNSWNTTSGGFLHALRNSWVTSFTEDSDGTLWVGSMGGLSRVRSATADSVPRGVRAAVNSALGDTRVMSLLVDRDDVLWVGTRNGGLSRYDRATETIRHYRHDPDDPATLGSDGVTSILQDQDGDIWVGTYAGGLNRLDADSGQIERFRHDSDDPRSLSSDLVTSVFEDTDGILWVGTENAGLNRFDRSTAKCRRYFHNPADGRSLSSDNAWFVTGDERGNLWIGTDGGGLNQWRAADRAAGRATFQRYSTLDGLPRNVIYSVVSDRQGHIWASSNGGLSRISMETRAVTNFNVSNGLQSDEFNHGAGFRSPSGELFFGGINGFNRFFPESIRPSTYPPPVVLTSFEKFNEPVDFDRPLSKIEQIDLGYKDSVIAFRFAALDFTAPAQNHYRYRLEGFDSDWIDAGTRRQATYTNLRPGGYVFKARGSNSDAVWSDEELAVRVLVAAPPWRTWQAYVLYVIAASTFIAAVTSSFVRRRRRAQELERINVSLSREIRERQAKEVALEAEKRKAREYLDVAEVIMLAIDPEGKVVLINQKGCRILGRREDEVVGRDWVADFVPLEHQSEVRRKLTDVGSYQYYEYPVLTNEGEERTIAWHSANLPESGEDPPVILSSGADTTQVRELEKQVRFHQKMDALGTLAGGVAHDFNNILTAIFGYSTLTLGQLQPESDEAGYLNNVVKACERAKDLVGRILTFSRRGEQDKRAIDVGEVVAEAGELLRSSLPATIEVRITMDSDCLPVMADPTQIHQVVMNLGTNAGQAMPGGGLLEITVEMTDLEPRTESSEDLRPGPHVVLTVRDTGHGIDSSVMEKIFDPFFTTKDVGEGTGLGLSVVHGIIKSHGGDIAVSSKTGEGTCFVAHLPCTRVREKERSIHEMNLAGKERILVVDDEHLICQLAEKILGGLGYTVTGATDGKTALKIFLDKPEQFDLVITDQMMPGVTGLELVREVHAAVPGIPVIITSGRKTDDLVQAPDVTFLQKPFKVADLGLAVRRVLDRVSESPASGTP